MDESDASAQRDQVETPTAIPTTDFATEPDHLLAGLVSVTNDVNWEIGIRLHVGGAVVSGLLISGESYFTLLAARIRDRETIDPAVESLASWYDSIRDDYKQVRESQDDWTRTVYVHLRDASLYAPGGGPIELGLWRGRLSMVSGWSLGSFSTTPSN